MCVSIDQARHEGRIRQIDDSRVPCDRLPNAGDPVTVNDHGDIIKHASVLDVEHVSGVDYSPRRWLICQCFLCKAGKGAAEKKREKRFHSGSSGL